MSAKTVIRGGMVVTMDPDIGDLPTGEVLVADGRIVEVGPKTAAEGAEVIDATNMIVIPGLVDTHRHTWQSSLRQIGVDWTLREYLGMLRVVRPRFTPQDVYIANLMGAVEALNEGITTLLDWSHIMLSPEHADAAVSGLVASGGRAVFAYGLPYDVSAEWYAGDVERLADTYSPRRDQLVTMALAGTNPEVGPMERVVQDLRLARGVGLRSTQHVGAGMMGANRGITQLDEAGLLGPDITFVHCNTCTDEELRRIAEAGCTVSISPRVELQMGHGHPATGRLLAVGIQPSLSIDVVTAVNGSIFDEMRATLEAERARHNEQALQRGEWPDQLALTSRDVVRMATIEGARTLGMEDRIGSLTPGKKADIVLLRVDAPNLGLVNNPTAAITFADSANVDTVLVAGRLVKAAGRLFGHDIHSLQDRAGASRDRLLAGTPYARA
jgi:5-methylthioadenosine/S-adenosylhomocysteine deaminase